MKACLFSNFNLRLLMRAALCAAALATVASTTFAQTPSLFEKITGRVPEPVSPDEAFRVTVRQMDATRIAVDYSIRPNYYLYRDRLAVSLQNAQGVRISRIDYPPGVIKEDKTFGRSEVYTKPFVVTVHLEGKGAVPAIIAKYQGCYELLGVCYPPETKAIPVVAKR
jgi:thiol:disulfide interchange protein DsbD